MEPLALMPELVQASHKVAEGMRVWRKHFPTMDNLTIVTLTLMTATMADSPVKTKTILKVGESVVKKGAPVKKKASVRQSRADVQNDILEVVRGDIFTVQSLCERLAAAGKIVRDATYYQQLLYSDKGKTFERVRQGEYRVRAPSPSSALKAPKAPIVRGTKMEELSPIAQKAVKAIGTRTTFSVPDILSATGLDDGRKLAGALEMLRKAKILKILNKHTSPFIWKVALPLKDGQTLEDALG